MGTNRSAWTPKEGQPVEVSVSLTRTCISRGATFIPQRHAEDLPAGSLTLVDKEHEHELTVEYLPPRELRGFDDYFQHIDLQPNDELVIKVFPDGRGELEFRRRPRRQPTPQTPPVSERPRAQLEEERPAFLNWRPEPSPRAPRPAAEAAPPPVDPPETRREPHDAQDPAPSPMRRPVGTPMRRQAARITDKISQGRALVRGWLQRGRPAPAAAEEGERAIFTPSPELASPAPSRPSLHGVPSAPPAHEAAQRSAPLPEPAADRTTRWDDAWGRDAGRRQPALASPFRATSLTAPAEEPRPAQAAPGPVAPPPRLIDDADFGGQTLDELEPALEPAAPIAEPVPQVPPAAPQAEPALDAGASQAAHAPETAAQAADEERDGPAPREQEAEAPSDPQPEAESAPGTPDTDADDSEPLRRMREHLSQPNTPAIVRAAPLAEALGLDAQVAASLLDHIASEPDSRLSSIQPGTYLVRRAT